jgi:glycosyltransferase involved in cell wall biosynthesis
MIKIPLVSIIINNYNYAHFLPKAIDSALNQTYSSVEVIVVDDGSTDNSQEIIRNYGNKIVPVLKENGDHASTFNAGFAASSGEIICCLDADDRFILGKIIQVVEVFTSHPEIGWCFHSLKLVDSETEQVLGVTRAFPKLEEDISTSCDFRTQLKKGQLPFYAPSTSALCFRRSLLEQILPMSETLKQAADRYLTYSSIFLSVGFFINQELTIQGIHHSNDGTLQQGERFRQHKARNQLLAAYLLRSKFSELAKFTNRLFARGFSYYWLNGIEESEGRKLIDNYYKTVSLSERLTIILMAIYHSRPWKKVQLYKGSSPLFD